MDKDLKKHQAGNTPEPGEEKIALLIKKAGAAAREKKKKMLEEHIRKVHLAVTGKLDSFEKSKSL